MSRFVFVGVDISKDKFDVTLRLNDKKKHSIFPNKPNGFSSFINWLGKNLEGDVTNVWVCMEATGSYHEALAEFLVKNKIRVSVCNPYQIKCFAKSRLVRNKNDKLDSNVIGEYGEQMLPRLYELTPKVQKEVRELTKILDTLKAQLTQLKNQLESCSGVAASKTLKQMIKKLEKDIEKIEKQIADIINNNEQLKEMFDLLTSISGIGYLTAFNLIARLPRLENFKSAKQFAAYIGVTPKEHQSGKMKGRTTISRLGDARLRKSLYMAALVAKRFNKALQPFVVRLEGKGKSPKTIICGVMRKLAHIIFGVLKNKMPFSLNWA